ncbi:MAG: putative rRNA maturation factor [Thermotogaceae bacterium]|nr:putative rRNA maturation factor [Thermotogaceae bacterium]MDN5337270.1 putative rRNA maturation factor [Thermotogaceae bacterium]
MNIINDTDEEIVNAIPIYDIIYEVLKMISPKLLSAEKEMNVVFVDKKTIKDLNLQFRGKNSETDVLSFSYDDEDDEIFGEVIICPEVIRLQAPDFGNSFEKELTYMLIHGILHLAGYEHENDPEDAKEMLTIQEEIFNVIKTKYIDKT